MQMQELDDNALLREYLEHNSEPAFAALVARHVNKVYSVALRHTRNPHQAEEITQAVFVILATKARGLGPGVILSGWLYETARLTAITFLRGEWRRARREEEAYMQTLREESGSDVWPQIAPLLDAAMAGLGELDRHAIVLRYFDDKSLREVGAALGASEDAAKMRVNRAVEKLRRFFARRGLVLPAATLAAALAANSVHAAPAVLAKTATAVAFAQGAAAPLSTVMLTKSALKLMAWSKCKTTVIAGLVLLVAGVTTGLVLTEKASPAKLTPRPPGATVPDRSTPIGTMLVMAGALESGDAQTFVDCHAFGTPDELKLKGAMEEFSAAIAKFTRALGDKFGATATHTVFPNLPFALPTNIIVSAEQKITGDTATVTFPGGKGGRPVLFTKVNGKWKMAADGFVHLSPVVMRDLFARVIKALEETTPEIPQDKFKTAMAAVDAVKERAR